MARGSSAKTEKPKPAPEVKAGDPVETKAADAAPGDGAADQSAAPDQGTPADKPEPAPEVKAEPIAEGDVTVIVAASIGGTRNGQPWPAVGEPFTLPAAEAAGYLKFGYVREAE